MRTGQVIQGGIERGLMGAAFAQIWRKYDIPSMTMICSDAHVPDYQCAMEKVMSITLQALAGSNMICFIGGVYDELTYSPEVSIIDNDIAKMVGRMLNGINTDISALAVDLIKEVGPIPGHYLNKKHTRETWKQEQLIPDLSNRLSHSEWAKEGQKDIITRAREKFQEIVEKHEPAPLTKEQDQEIENILTAARKHYAKLGLA
jgi:trimethylamine--corrinoid protein Co-methyltransferase